MEMSSIAALAMYLHVTIAATEVSQRTVLPENCRLSDDRVTLTVNAPRPVADRIQKIADVDRQIDVYLNLKFWNKLDEPEVLHSGLTHMAGGVEAVDKAWGFSRTYLEGPTFFSYQAEEEARNIIEITTSGTLVIHLYEKTFNAPDASQGRQTTVYVGLTIVAVMQDPVISGEQYRIRSVRQHWGEVVEIPNAGGVFNRNH